MSTQQSRVLVQLRGLILNGTFAPGERLAEIPLSERLNTSRTPIRQALATLEHEGLIESSPGGGYQMRAFTMEEVADAIRLRGVIEGFAARTLAERGASKALTKELKKCLEEGDAVVYKDSMDLDDYTRYARMNDRFHQFLIQGCGNKALMRVMDQLNSQAFGAPSATLPMQSSMEEGQEWMKIAHHTHHAIVQAIERGQGSRAQALGEEHVEIARQNLQFALQDPELAIRILPGIQMVSGVECTVASNPAGTPDTQPGKRALREGRDKKI
ncbi:MAG: GntR family transcriptional regulator [Pusillimonas sp.]|nr:GntR family transcriptional regulator [Pusillimonas sp.]MBC41434.1 GntR family transcriptional regulator [Pusillimonas sp.]HCP79122.1 GntR family transcriptional regulator [Pusillimonas sp.]|tara:strand:- start:20033 stop:20845 length:813 start_codon:yes stop_codon:yes gene_type:complete